MAYLDPQRSALLCQAFFNGDLKALQPHSSPEMKEAIVNGTLALGGMILPRIASKTSIPAGYLFLAAPATSLPDVLEEQGIYLLRQNSTLPETEKRKLLPLSGNRRRA